MRRERDAVLCRDPEGVFYSDRHGKPSEGLKQRNAMNWSCLKKGNDGYFPSFPMCVDIKCNTNYEPKIMTYNRPPF